MIQPITTGIPFFNAAEIRCKHCNLIRVDPVFASVLVTLRFLWADPLYATSFCRCPVHNDIVGGHPRSMHKTNTMVGSLGGTAGADLAWGDWPADKKLRFCQLAWSLGLSIGLSSVFVHLDLRTRGGHEQHIFTYNDWDGEITPGDIKGERDDE